MSDTSPDPDALRVFDIGGSHVTAAVVAAGAAPRILAAEPRALENAAQGGDLVDRIAEAADALPLGGRGWTVAIPGPFDYVAGRGSFAGVGKFARLSGVDLRGRIADRLGVAPADLVFLNDAVAYGLGEWVGGLAGTARRAICVALGTGIGSVFLDDGEVVSGGPSVPPHGFLHYLELDGVPIEDMISTRAIRRGYERETGSAADVVDIAGAARRGDSAAVRALDAAMGVLGEVLGEWSGRFDADAVVVGGSMSRSWDLLEAPIRAGLARALPAAAQAPLLRPSTLLDDAPLLGAATWRQQADAGRASRP